MPNSDKDSLVSETDKLPFAPLYKGQSLTSQPTTLQKFGTHVLDQLDVFQKLMPFLVPMAALGTRQTSIPFEKVGKGLFQIKGKNLDVDAISHQLTQGSKGITSPSFDFIVKPEKSGLSVEFFNPTSGKPVEMPDSTLSQVFGQYDPSHVGQLKSLTERNILLGGRGLTD